MTATFAPDEQILLYTDRVTEARDRQGRFYPLPGRVGLPAAADPDAALDALRRTGPRFGNGRLAPRI